MADHFWLSDKQWLAIGPHVPQVCAGMQRSNDRRVISGIVHKLREGCSWYALPIVYGPYTTVYNRYKRWSRRGALQAIITALVESDGPPARGLSTTGMLDAE